MPALSRYPDFLDRIDELGFMLLSDTFPGLPSLSSETPSGQWFTGDMETDPWRWKDRAAEEHKVAYGCILGGHKGFIAQRLYPCFYAACHPSVDIRDRWEAGEINQTTWQLWCLFEKHPLLDTSNTRKLMGVTAARGGSRVDASLRDLQKEFYITITGSRQKIGRNGQPYGWAACTFVPVLAWFRQAWLPQASNDPRAAREAILEQGIQNGAHVSRQDLERILGW